MLSNGEVLNSRYRIVRRLNKGGMGTVYEAFDTVLNAHVAIKENHFEDESQRTAFRREAQLLANLHHPSLPHCSDLFSSAEGKQYLVMEFIEGDDLATLMSKHKMPLSAETVLDWAKQILDVLEYLHSQPTLHRDIKPANIKLKDGRVYLLDFGLAYGQCGDMTTISDFNWSCYSTRYSPLEQLRRGRTMPASDLYSLAATLYMLLTNVPPYNAEHRLLKIMFGKGDPLKDIGLHRPDLDKGFRQTIMRALALDIDQRPSSAAEMRRLIFSEPVARVARPRLKLSWKALVTVLLAGTLTLVILFGLGPNLINGGGQSALQSLLGMIGRGESQHGDPDRPRTPLEEAARLTEEAERLLQQAKYDEAMKKVEAALALDPNNAYAHFIYGDILWDTKGDGVQSASQMAEVQEQAEIILRLVLSPGSPKEYIARAWANMAKGKLDIAIADATTALESQPDSIAALMIRASAKGGQVEVDNRGAIESIADYDKVTRLMPGYAQAYANRAAVYYALGQLNLALSDFTAAIKLAPRASFHYRLGYIYFNLQEFAEARSNFQKALELNPQYYQAFIGLADVYFQAEDWNNSVRNYTLASQISPMHYAFSRLGNAYLYLKQFERAIESYKKALEFEPKDYRSRSGLGFSYASLENFEAAIDSYTKALNHVPKENREFRAYVYKNRAQAYRQSGRDELAANDEEQAAGLE